MEALFNISVNDCWLYAGYKTVDGYGKLPSQDLAHRVMYEVFVGEIPAGLHIDHLCRSRSCINPGHLEAVTCRENILRGVGPAAKRAKQTHCIHGHLLSGENLYLRVDSRGGRECRKCRAIADQKYRRNKCLTSL